MAAPAEAFDRLDLRRLVLRGITAINGKSRRSAKYASDTAVEPDEASTSVVPGPMWPLQMP